MKKSLFVLLGLSGMLMAEIVPKEIPSPVVLLQPEQKKIMQYDTHEERANIMKEDHKLPKEKRLYCSPTAKWREALPVTFAWTCTDGEVGPFTVTFADNEAFENPQYAYSRKDTDTSVTPPNYLTNFKIGQKYYWKVTGKSKDKKEVTSAVSSFTTEDMAPRWIKLEGRVGNTRDLGGWKTMDGRRIKQNMIFRGQGLNDNSANGRQPGRNRLTAADIDWMLQHLYPEIGQAHAEAVVETYSAILNLGTDSRHTTHIFSYRNILIVNIMNQFISQLQIRHRIVVDVISEILPRVVESLPNAVVFIQHRGHAVETVAVEMVFLKPELHI